MSAGVPGGAVAVVNATGSYLVVRDAVVGTTALAVIPVVDEWTGAAPAALTVTSLTRWVAAHVSGGAIVLTGRPDLAWPDLATADQHVTVRWQRPDSPAETVTITVPAGSALPFPGTPLAVRADTITVRGLVRLRAFPHPPVPGATVTIGGTTTALVVVSPPLTAAHPAGSLVRVRTLSPSTATTLSADTVSGVLALPVASTAGFATGDAVEVGGVLAGTIVAVLGPTVVTLDAPLAVTASAGTPVAVHSLVSVGAGATLSRDALPGDGLLPVSGALVGDVVEVGGPVSEVRRTGLTTGPDGRWLLGGVRGIPEITLTVAASGLVTVGPITRQLRPTGDAALETDLHP